MLLACMAGGMIFSACGGESSSLGNPVVPGGAALTVKAGTAAICSQLVHSAAIRGISTDLTGLTQSPPPQPAVEGLRNAAGEFRALANRAPVALQTELIAVASALGGLRVQGIGSAAAVTALNNSLTQLGGEVQSQCGFPVG
jgi:hypothetical protein